MPPVAMLQMPPQHSVSCAHASPFCTQYDDPAQILDELQKPEQQSVLAPQVLPAVLQTLLSGVHVFDAEHMPLQHSLSAAQVWLSDTHWFPEQTLPMQLPEQQSVGFAQVVPPAEHIVGFVAQVCAVTSHTFEQQSPSPVQPCPNVWQTMLASTTPPSMSSGWFLLPQAARPTAIAKTRTRFIESLLGV
jgi:hypothetical protein